MRSNVYKKVGSLVPGRSAFDLSYEKIGTCDMGQLIPIMCDEIVPGDFFKIGVQAVLRFMPLVAPPLHQVDAYFHYYFVPNRLMWNAKTREELSELSDWEEFITRGVSGDEEPVIPTWEPVDTAEGSLWDYMGFPTGVDPDGAYPVDFPRRAYNLVYNTFYRDENLIAEVSLQNEDILLRSWLKDYFSSSLPWQQRGTPAALPISGSVPVSGIGSALGAFATAAKQVYETDGTGLVTYADSQYAGVANDIYIEEDPTNAGYPNIRAELDSATTFNVADLRLAFQIQKWQERNARAGIRYTEFLKSHFGASPRDDRLDRPEYIGGAKCPIIFSEVLQTSETNTTVQGTMAGHGITVADQFCGKYKAEEFGVVIGIMSIMPKPVYQQGMPRQWLKETTFDYYFPEFANLSEQAIIQAEIFADGVPANNQTIFGYQGRYDELRTKQSMVVGQMRSTFDYWHISRQFGAAPSLNQAFIECSPRKDIFAAPSEPGIIFRVGNLWQGFRPVPITAEPGLIDHN